MDTVPNQKTITTKSAKHDKNNLYAPLNIEAMEKAMGMLKPNTFKLWCYMAKNQNNYTFALSCVEACGFCKMSKPTYLASVQELIDNGYLVNTSGNNGLSTGGTGDVLAGIISGLIAQGLNNIEAASLGVYIHGIAAENYVDKANCYSLNATDLLEEIQYVL